MDVSRIRALRGPNLWSRHTAIEAVVSCAPQECALDKLPGFEDALRKLFPTLGSLHPEEQADQVSLAHVLEVAALALQAQAGCPVTFSRTAATTEPGIYQVVVAYSEEEVGRQALTLAQALIQAALTQGSFDAAQALAQLRDL